ncbi:MAG: DcaP family trimeric outer membrane transporter [Pseudomonadota bacterium]
MAALQEQLEALTALVEQQSEQIDKQADEIDRLRGYVVVDRAPSHTAPEDEEIHFVDVVEPAGDGDTVVQFETEQERPAQDVSTETAAARRVGRYPDMAIVRPGDFDGSISLPGTGGSLRVGGMVRSELSFDFDNIGIQFAAIPTDIPLDGSSADGTTQTQFNARNSQFNVDYRRDTERGLFRTFIEFDFFGDGTEFDNDYGLRLRHAAVGLGNLQFGQFWSLFTNLRATPEVGDLIGPHGAPILRTPGLRWYDTIGEDWVWAIGIENPAGDISGEAPDLASESVPNVLGYIERRGDWGHVRLSGLGLELTSSEDSVFTGAASLSGQIRLSSISEADNLMFGVQYGSGFAKQFAGFGGAGLEGVVDQAGNLDATETLAGFASYQHWWSDDWRSTAYVSFFDFDQGLAADPDSLSYSFKTAANLFWTPVTNASIGGELLYLTRETVSGDRGDGVRLQAVAQFNF